MLLTVELAAPLHRQVLDECRVVAELDGFDAGVFFLKLGEDGLAAAAAERILHDQVDHVVDADVLVEGGVPLQHTVLAGLDDWRA